MFLVYFYIVSFSVFLHCKLRKQCSRKNISKHFLFLIKTLKLSKQLCFYCKIWLKIELDPIWKPGSPQTGFPSPRVLKDISTFILIDLLYIIPKFPERPSELHHICGDGVEILESAAYVTGTFLNIKSIVQNNLVTESNTIQIMNISWPPFVKHPQVNRC